MLKCNEKSWKKGNKQFLDSKGHKRLFMFRKFLKSKGISSNNNFFTKCQQGQMGEKLSTAYI